MKRRIWAVLLVGAMLFSTTACGQQQNGEQQTILIQEDEEEAYPTTTAEYGEVIKNITVRCTYTSTEQQDLSFPVDGKLIERVEIKAGDYVTKGQLLAALDVEDLEEKIEELEYQISSLELRQRQTEEMKAFDLASAETLFSYTNMKQRDKEELKEKQKSINKQYQTTLEDLADSLVVQNKRLQQYREELEEGRLFADITGEVTYVEALVNSYSIKDKVVVTVSNLDACYFVADDITYADCFKEGSSVIVNYMDGAEGYTCEVIPALMESWDEKMYFKPVENEMIANQTYGTITMELDRKENVLCIPSDALHKSDDAPFVYLEKDGLLEMRYVTVGLEGDTMVEITDGLEQGETVALKK